MVKLEEELGESCPGNKLVLSVRKSRHGDSFLFYTGQSLTKGVAVVSGFGYQVGELGRVNCPFSLIII